ncbi:MAG: histidine phosphatase family protein [Lachnospiraceae bacterium]|nr:histidine phosphatase family protein [Lachnospiraceae bacterium]
MRLIFIRHGDPDYENDTLTEKGRREAALLAQRVKNWEITEIFRSPLGRAVATSEYCLKELGRTATTYDWLREFAMDVKSPDGTHRWIPWDYMPDYWTRLETMYDRDHWMDASVYDGSEIRERYAQVAGGIDRILEKYGYRRDGRLYRTEKEGDDTTLVFFCHLGVSFVALSHLLGIPATLLWHGFFVAPTAVTVVGCEEREPGIGMFRVQVFGDTSHLIPGGEPISGSGYFTEPFQG